ncbi:protein eva-1 homolog C-like isoform X1 [Acipenser ruthenus]|uniref:protein eva-1 homolog C-like isoform X1 n=1 Tax=Acipenser ruthenus TaxID=7906 RepID=UPI00145B823C|nr:protein eva-1 homolog C-like isoform X1 [Acipenser ruthenus]
MRGVQSLGGSTFVLSLSLTLLCFSSRLLAAPDFSGYLQKILKNHTVHACDGERLTVTCPYKTSITVLSAFYGRRVPSENLCPTVMSTSEERTDCQSSIAITKVFAECQDQRTCQLPVNSRVFGLDPCPSTSKYLIVSFKCRPENHSSKVVCENEKLRLVCKNQTVLAIYSATFGHLHHGNPECPQGNSTGPDIECLAPSALKKVSRRCHSKPNCSVSADMHTFGDPCFPGVRKHLRVSYTCVPRNLLEELGRGSPDPFSLSDYTHGGWYTGPGVSRLQDKLVIFTSSLEIFAQIRGWPEKVALYFVSGICAGLVLLSCLFGLKATLVRDIKGLCSELEEELKVDLPGEDPSREEIEDYDDDTSSDSSFRRLTRSYRVSENIFSPEVTAELVDRAEVKEPGDNEIWLHKDSSPYAIHTIKAATK